MSDGLQSMLAPHGPDAAMIAGLAWVLFAGAAAIFAAVMALAAYAVFARRDRAARLPPRALIVGGGIVFPALTLAALLAYTVARSAPAREAAAPALRIQVTGHQWWWRVRYLDAQGRRDFSTANEIRIPVGRPVELVLGSDDVLHSFWVPALAGKLDMIPGRETRLTLRADRAGQYRGQCAEYCGGPHALMAFFVVADEAPAHERWMQAQREPARNAAGEASEAGARLFASHCAGCHTVRGTAAAGTLGPDLTHVGSRLTLGAALLPNNAGTLEAWIASSQHLKPGNLMPSFGSLSAPELRALAAYLGALR